MVGALLWLFFPALDAVKLILKAGFVCPFVVIDPTDSGTAIVVAQAFCLTIFNLSENSEKDNTYLSTYGNQASVRVM